MPLATKGAFSGTARPPDYIISIDKQEKKVIPFPKWLSWKTHPEKPAAMLKIATESVHLKTGDIALRGHYYGAVAERKGSIVELYKNFFTRDRYRQHRAFARLRDEVAWPILYLDFQIGDLATSGWEGQHPTKGDFSDQHIAVATQIAVVTAAYGFTLIGPLPTTRTAKTKQAQRDRRWAAEFLLRLLICHAMNPRRPQVEPQAGKILTPRP